MTQYGFYFDSARCTGCKTCVMACKDYLDLGVEHACRQVYDYEGGTWSAAEGGAYTQDVYAYHLSMSCNHCEVPACVENCPSGAMTKNEETGLVSSDPEVCIGCGTCATACPYGVPKLNEETSLTVKCDGCASRVSAGQQPICVESCPLRALEFGDIEELKSAHSDAVDGVAPMPADAGTGPSILIKMAPAAKAMDDTTGFVANTPEIV